MGRRLPVSADQPRRRRVDDKAASFIRFCDSFNLPLVFVLYAIPEVLARLLAFTGLDATTWLTLCLYAAIIGSFLACRSLTHKVPSLAHPLTEALVPPTLLFLFVGKLLSGFMVDSFGTALLGSILYSIISWLLASLLLRDRVA